MKIVGIMSGTSADGVDAALVNVEAEGDRLAVTVFAWLTIPFTQPVRDEILAVSDPKTGTVDRVCRLNALLGEWFARAAAAVVEQAGLRLHDVDAIASHGQTIYHAVGGAEVVRSTLQIASPAVLAERTGRTVIADFRPRDVAAGGQGAPLTSYVDQLLFSHPVKSRALQNIGGISNLTFLPALGSAIPALAFDTGPGNIIIDTLARELFDAPCDADGLIARSGRVDESLLAAHLDDPYYAQPPPKTTGREKYGSAFVSRLRSDGDARSLPDRDLVATATALTARSIADAYRRFVPVVDEIIVSGGGAANATLMDWLTEALRGNNPSVAVRRIEELGIPSDAKEAIVFAVLGYESLHGRPGALPCFTGASHPVVLGSIVPGDNYLDLIARVVDSARPTI